MGFNRSYLPIHSTHEIGRDNIDFQTTITTSSAADTIVLTQSGNGEVSQIVFNQSNVRVLLAIMADIADGCGFSTKPIHILTPEEKADIEASMNRGKEEAEVAEMLEKELNEDRLVSDNDNTKDT